MAKRKIILKGIVIPSMKQLAVWYWSTLVGELCSQIGTCFESGWRAFPGCAFQMICASSDLSKKRTHEMLSAWRLRKGESCESRTCL